MVGLPPSPEEVAFLPEEPSQSAADLGNAGGDDDEDGEEVGTSELALAAVAYASSSSPKSPEVVVRPITTANLEEEEDEYDGGFRVSRKRPVAGAASSKKRPKLSSDA